MRALGVQEAFKLLQTKHPMFPEHFVHYVREMTFVSLIQE